MKDYFTRVATDHTFLQCIKGDPIKEAVFHAFNKFVQNGGDLLDLPWFSLVKQARSKKKLTKVAKVA